MLTFAIPTWNRPSQFEKCVRSIASQITDPSKASILIGDDCSEQSTVDVIEKLKAEYPFIQSYRNERRSDYTAAFKRLFTAPELADGYVWTFGDDDLLEPNALKFMLEELDRHPDIDFFHVAEASRASEKSGAFTGTLFDLCCEFGWIEMTGFITGNLTRVKYLRAAGDSPRWPHYARCAFAQSCALLEILHDKQALFLDVPLIRTQDNSLTDESMKRWTDDDIPGRYMLVAECLRLMYEAGILQVKVPKKFFRYLVYHLWDRFITYMVNDYIDRGQMWPPDRWGQVKSFAHFLADEKEAAEICNDVDACQGLIFACNIARQQADSFVRTIAEVAIKRNAEIYSYGYREAGTGRPVVVSGEPVDHHPV